MEADRKSVHKLPCSSPFLCFIWALHSTKVQSNRSDVSVEVINISTCRLRRVLCVIPLYRCLLQVAGLPARDAGHGPRPQHDDGAVRPCRRGAAEDVLRVSVQQPVLPRQVLVLLRYCSRHMREPRHAGGLVRGLPTAQRAGSPQGLETSVEAVLPQEAEGPVGAR